MTVGDNSRMEIRSSLTLSIDLNSPLRISPSMRDHSVGHKSIGFSIFKRTNILVSNRNTMRRQILLSMKRENVSPYRPVSRYASTRDSWRASTAFLTCMANRRPTRLTLVR